jgi:hypothetical protein
MVLTAPKHDFQFIPPSADIISPARLVRSGMPTLTRQKITFAEMRAAGVRGLLIYCSDFKCSHWTAINGDRWPDGVRLSDIEPRFTCQACGQRGADVRPNFVWEADARPAKILVSVRRMPNGGANDDQI